MEKMLAFRQSAPGSTEAGGVLVGHRRDPHLEITNVTTPGPKDVRARARFKRKDPSHKKFVENQWVSSSRMVDYLGEWHTHPEKHPRPSGLDIGECIRVTLTYPRKPILEVVIGTDSMWVGSYGLVRMESLKPILPESGS
jgi:integrative and conjugative element protein (TIGR02256 family)